MADFFLTHRAMRDLLEIEAYSLEAFGAARTRRYMDDLYRVFNNLAENPNLGNLRRHRSEPFLMAPAGQHCYLSNLWARHYDHHPAACSP